MRWIAKKTGPAAQTITSEEELEEVKEGHEVFLLGYFDNFEVCLPKEPTSTHAFLAFMLYDL